MIKEKKAGNTGFARTTDPVRKVGFSVFFDID